MFFFLCVFFCFLMFCFFLLGEVLIHEHVFVDLFFSEVGFLGGDSDCKKRIASKYPQKCIPRYHEVPYHTVPVLLLLMCFFSYSENLVTCFSRENTCFLLCQDAR